MAFASSVPEVFQKQMLASDVFYHKAVKQKSLCPASKSDNEGLFLMG